MREFNVKAEDRFNISSTSKGNQIKWVKDNCYIKADTMGYEGYTEWLVSKLLECIKSNYEYIKYSLCEINERDDEIEETVHYKGCYSKNYLSEGEEFISIYRLLKQRDKNFERAYNNLSGEQKVEYVIQGVKDSTGLIIRDYLEFIIKLDAIVLNEDRHLNNISLVYNEKKEFRVAPIFDNGLSLLSDIHSYPMHLSIDKCIRRVKSKPFSSNISNQLSYFSKSKIRIDYDKFLELIKSENNTDLKEEHIRARRVILRRLMLKENELWERI